MTAPSSNRFDSVASAGASTGLSGLVPIVTVRAPTSLDIFGPWGPLKPGQSWIDTVGHAAYTLVALTSSLGTVTADWQATGGGTSSLSSLTGTTGTATPTGGNILIQGTTNQIVSSATGSTVTLRLPVALTAPGSVTATTFLTATLGDITVTNGNFVKGTAGNKDIYTSVASTTTAGANSAGTVVLVGGTATVSTTAVTGSSLIRMSRQGIGATGAAAIGILSVGTIVAGTSFVINSVSEADATALAATDVSVIFWEIVN